MNTCRVQKKFMFCLTREHAATFAFCDDAIALSSKTGELQYYDLADSKTIFDDTEIIYQVNSSTKIIIPTTSLPISRQERESGTYSIEFNDSQLYSSSLTANDDELKCLL